MYLPYGFNRNFLSAPIDMAVFESHDTIGQSGYLTVMGRHDQCCLLFPVKIQQQIEYRPTALGIQITGRFIGEDNLGMVDDRPTDGHPLHFSTGELVGKIERPV